MNSATVKVIIILALAAIFPIVFATYFGSLLGPQYEYSATITGVALALFLWVIIIFVTSYKYAFFGMKLFFNKGHDIYIRTLKNRGMSIDVDKRQDEVKVIPTAEDSKVPLKEVPPHIDMASRRPVHILVQDVREEVDLLKSYVPDMALRRINQAIAHAFETGLRIGQRLKENRMLMIIMVVGIINIALTMVVVYYAQQAYQTAQGAASSAQELLQIVKDLNAQVVSGGIQVI